jgi:hypothetical protein
MFGDRHIKTVSNFEIKFLGHCFVAFGVKKILLNP